MPIIVVGIFFLDKVINKIKESRKKNKFAKDLQTYSNNNKLNGVKVYHCLGICKKCGEFVLKGDKFKKVDEKVTHEECGKSIATGIKYSKD